MKKDRLVTKRLILRAWQESDAESLYKYAQNPAIGPVAGWPPHTSVEDSLNVIRTVFAAPETYAAVLKETGEPVGSIGIMFGDGLHSAEMRPGEAEIGYWIGVPYWGQGLIPEAVRCLLKRCFEDLGMTAVWCGYYDGNVKSRRVMEKCGFRFHHTEEGKRMGICPTIAHTSVDGTGYSGNARIVSLHGSYCQFQRLHEGRSRRLGFVRRLHRALERAVCKEQLYRCA